MQFHIEREMIRRRRAPAFYGSLVGNRVKCRLDLDHLEMLRVPAEPLVRGHPFRIPTLDKSRIGPARSPDQNVAAIVLRRTRCCHPPTETTRSQNANFLRPQ